MIGLDTNVLVRYLTQDDKQQAARATRLIERELSEQNPGYISVVVLVEMCWVLKSLFQATPQELHTTLQDLLGTRQFEIESRAAVADALSKNKTTKDFADNLITALCMAAGCTKVMTIDKTAAKAGMSLLR